MTETARTFLARVEGQVVFVQLRDRQVRGKLTGWDEFINLVLEDDEEVLPTGSRKPGKQVVVRGSQVTAIHATKLGPPIAEAAGQTVWSGSRGDRGGPYQARSPYGDRDRYRR
ncbi:snRNP Sm protein [mine drainage metagenome]|uniref:SnRNP Sm protein n=1 Tax=mine drainage metagenome TaxID=410659 RepID=T1BWS2_9ZZZZ